MRHVVYFNPLPARGALYASLKTNVVDKDTTHFEPPIIMFKNEVSVTLIDSVTLDNGRGVLCNVQHNESYFSLVNIYAPSIEKQRNYFFNLTVQWIKGHSQGETTRGGDSSTVYDVQIYKKRLSNKRKSNGSNFRKFKKSQNLVDIWRNLVTDI